MLQRELSIRRLTGDVCSTLLSVCVYSLVWLREQLVHGGIPVWLQNNPQAAAAAANDAAGPPAADPANNQQVQVISCFIKTKLNLHQ